MDKILKSISDKKKSLDQFKPFPKALVANLNEWYKVELTFNSNAIEGNTLSRKETAQIVEKGLTVKGKSITEHLEAVNHAEAFEYINRLKLKSISKIDQRLILDIHSIILKGINQSNAGTYRSIPVRIAGSTVVLPNPQKMPDLMKGLLSWLHKSKDNIVKIAADFHFKLVSIHPFIDGNGRVARLLMNLILIIGRYPVVIIKKEDRGKYIDSIEKGQLTGDLSEYYSFMYKSVDNSIDFYLNTIHGKVKKSVLPPSDLLKIGELAKKTRETVPTIRYWTKENLLKVSKLSPGGYQLYSQEAIKTVKKIRRLQKEKRLTIKELKKLF